MLDFFTQIYHQFIILLESWGYTGLFCGTAMASSVVPFPSGVLFLFCVTTLNPVRCVCVAAVGNTLGSMILYYFGTKGDINWFSKYTKVNINRVRRVRYYLRHRGSPMAFFAFLPGLGQCISIALGLLRCNWMKVVFFMLLGKFIRFAFIAYLALSVI